jgi:hypothetical protein
MTGEMSFSADCPGQLAGRPDLDTETAREQARAEKNGS